MRKTLLFLAALFSFNVNAQEADARLLEINFSSSSNPALLGTINSKIIFTADDGVTGRELWVFDTETGESSIVAELGITHAIESLIIDDMLYLMQDAPFSSGSYLWKTDGTEEGTVLLAQFCMECQDGGTAVPRFTNLNGILYFSANDAVSGVELWKSDGTPEGTVMVKDINPGPGHGAISDFTAFNNELYFVANDGVNGRALWKSNGTEEGTYLFKDFGGNNSIYENKFLEFNGYLYFFAEHPTAGMELWRTDGTIDNTILFKDTNPGEYGSNVYMVGAATSDYFVFKAVTQDTGIELWVSDGTPEGTLLIKDVWQGHQSGLYSNTEFVFFDGKFYFVGEDDNGKELWVTDGTTDGTYMVKDIEPGSNSSYIKNLTATSDYLIFSAWSDLNGPYTVWKSDGTTNGTIELAPISVNDDYLSFEEVNNFVYFPAITPANGSELWRTDGITSNNVLISDINHTAGAYPSYPTAIDDNLYFVANNGVHGFEPYISNGTTYGTRLSKDINPGEFGSVTNLESNNPGFTKSGQYVFFSAYTNELGRELYRTDGTSANTALVKDINPGTESSLSIQPEFIDYNNHLYFFATTPEFGTALWKSDGTEEGTIMVKDLSPALQGGFLVAHNFFILNGYLYFGANDGTDDSIWKTDGTSQGTVKVITQQLANHVNSPRLIAVANGKLFFLNRMTGGDYNQFTLFATDGTQAGTTEIGTWLYYSASVVHNDRVYITAREIQNGTHQLITTDGTFEGTEIIPLSTEIPGISSLISCGEFVYIAINHSGNLKSLYRTDGTSEGTILIVDNELYKSLTCHQEKMYYVKSFISDKLWQSDGTLSGTTEVVVNMTNADPFQEFEPFGDWLVSAGTQLYTVGLNDKFGKELYVLAPDGSLGVTNPVAVHDKANFDVTVYPNPSYSNYVNLISAVTIDTVEVYNLNGQLINKVVNPIQENNTYKISNMPQGFYLLKITAGENIVTKKIIVN